MRAGIMHFFATHREALSEPRDPHHDRTAQKAAQFRAHRKEDASETPGITRRLKSSSTQWHRTAPQQCNQRHARFKSDQKRVALPLCASPHARLHTVCTPNSQWPLSILRTRSARPRARRGGFVTGRSVKCSPRQCQPASRSRLTSRRQRHSCGQRWCRGFHRRL